MDVKTKKILYCLELNGRATELELAKQVGVSREQARVRLNNLETTKTIKNYMVLVNSLNFGFLMFRVYYNFTNIDLKKESEIISYLQKNVNWVTKVEGRWNLVTMSFSRDVFDFSKFITDLKMKFGEFIQDFWVSTLTGLWHFKRDFLLPQKNTKKGDLAIKRDSIKMGPRTNKPSLDNLDLNILKLLLKNGRASYVNLGNTLNVNAKLIRDRINRMIKQEVILGFSPSYDMKKLGYLYFKVHFKLKNYSVEKYNSLVEYSLQHPNIVFMVEAVGGADWEIEIQVENNSQLYNIIRDIKIQFSSIIHSYYFLEYTEEFTLDYLPRQLTT